VGEKLVTACPSSPPQKKNKRGERKRENRKEIKVNIPYQNIYVFGIKEKIFVI
jgi:hypothetical protein